MRFLTLADGRRLAWREAGSGPPLVLLHGWAMSSAVFAEVLPALAGRYRVLTPDLPGHGDSDAGCDYRLEALATDLAGWLAALDLAQVDLLGWSLGGQVALELVLDYPRLVRRLILVATTPKFVAAAGWDWGLPDGQVRAMARDLGRAYERTMGDFFMRQFVGEELSRDRLRQITGFAVRPSRLPRPEVALAALETLRQGDLRGRLGEIACPVLVQQGDLDVITPPAAATALAEALPVATLAVMKGIGHGPFLSLPGASVRSWEAFLA